MSLRKRSVKNDSKILSLSIWKKALPFTKKRWTGRSSFGGIIRSLVLDMFQVPIGNLTGNAIKSKGLLLLPFTGEVQKGNAPCPPFLPHPFLPMGQCSRFGVSFTATHVRMRVCA